MCVLSVLCVLMSGRKWVGVVVCCSSVLCMSCVLLVVLLFGI